MNPRPLCAIYFSAGSAGSLPPPRICGETGASAGTDPSSTGPFNRFLSIPHRALSPSLFISKIPLPLFLRQVEGVPFKRLTVASALRLLLPGLGNCVDLRPVSFLALRPSHLWTCRREEHRRGGRSPRPLAPRLCLCAFAPRSHFLPRTPAGWPQRGSASTSVQQLLA